jgi:hypothetical protein
MTSDSNERRVVDRVIEEVERELAAFERLDEGIDGTPARSRRVDPFTYARDVSKREVAERLKEVPLFRDCSSRQLRRIAGRGWERDYPAGSALCEEGRLGDDFFIILQGQADVTRKRKKLRSLGPGFGVAARDQ